MASRAYFDTSVLVKRYVNERGSRSARGLFRRFRVVSCVLATLEGSPACAWLKAIGELSEGAFNEVLQHTQLRTLDALHVASALVFQDRSSAAVPFVTADERQSQAAQRMGLRVIWVDGA
jgi:predicted nucleic acid-binding protein